MSTENINAIALKCDYCGRENPERHTACPGCGQPLVEISESIEDDVARKSKLLAVLLAFFLGGLGLLYVRAWRTAVVLSVAFGLLLIYRVRFAPHAAWTITLAVHLYCACWAYYTVIKYDKAPDPRREAFELLQAAATLEGTNREQAIAAYEDVVRKYPDSAAAKEALNNIQILTRS